MDDPMNVAAVSRKPITLALSDIILDPDLQPRQRIDEATCKEYLDALIDGAVFPPVTVFREGAQHWLADGYHRLHAHKAAGLTEIRAIVAPGTRLDALRFALGANAIHGKRREAGDYRAAYIRACDNGLVDPVDSDAVQALLRCTIRWAITLTEAARADANRARDAEIVARKAAGQSNRAIARDVGVSHQTVGRAVSGPKTNTSQMDHPAEPKLLHPLPANAPKPLHPAQVEFNDMTSPRGQRWGTAPKSTGTRRVRIDRRTRAYQQGAARKERESADRLSPLVKRATATIGSQDLFQLNNKLVRGHPDRSMLLRLLAAETQPVLI
jgi:hypothetical protein